MKIVPATVRILFVASHESSPAIVLHLYELAGVRLMMPALSFRYASLFTSLSAIAATGVSNAQGGTGGSLPVLEAGSHGKYGPGLAFRYQESHSTVGGAIAVTVLSMTLAQALSAVPAPPPAPCTHGLCSDWLR